MLVTPVHDLKRAKFPAIDYHHRLDAQDPATVLKVMDECGIERIVNITMQVGNEALAVIRAFSLRPLPGRFATYAWMDWTDLHRADFFSRCADRLDKMVEHGACGLKVWKDLGTSLRDATGDLLRVDDERLAPMFEKAAELGVPVMFHTADPDAFFLPSMSATSALKSWRRIRTGASAERTSASRNFCSNAIACSRAIPARRLLPHMSPSVRRSFRMSAVCSRSIPTSSWT